MQLSSVLLARSIAFLDINELNPRGGIFFPLLVSSIVERYGFLQFPTKLEDFDDDKGTTFRSGYFEGQTIDELTVYGDGIKIDLRSSTEKGKLILEEALSWLSSEHGLSYRPRSITRWGYISNVTFVSDVDFDELMPPLTQLRDRLAYELRDDARVNSPIHVDSISLDLERLIQNRGVAPFQIQRRAKVPASEGKYFSSAPLPTETHLSVIQEFEENIRLYKDMM